MPLASSGMSSSSSSGQLICRLAGGGEGGEGGREIGRVKVATSAGIYMQAIHVREHSILVKS